MANIRAYKLAEELGIDRAAIVERAAEVGIELRGPMAAVDDETAVLLREKLGKPAEPTSVVTERRVQSGGAAVIRRRKKAAEIPAPEPVAEELAPSAPEPVAAAPAAVPPETDGETPPAPPAVAVEEPEPAPRPIAAQVEERETPRPSAGMRLAPEAPERAPGPDRSGRQRKLVREVVNLREQETLARQAVGRAPIRRQVTVDPRTLSSPRRKRRDALNRPAAARSASEQRRGLRIEGQISVGELARQLGSKAPDVQRKLMALGTMVSINTSIDVATAAKVAAEFGFDVQDTGFKEQAFFAQPSESAEALVARPPVVTVMGHVDHGKTSLLDAIRHANVVAGEAGGITQHIGAYQVEKNSQKITFIDTPGHAAFTAMRARGAQVTDIAVLVVAADGSVMPQTIESINHAKAAGVPIIVAINKIDKPSADPQKVRNGLLQHEVFVESMGGETLDVEVSAKTGAGLDKLLEAILLQAEIQDLKADPTRTAEGVVVEAQLERGRGSVATVLVQKGTLHPGDIIVAGSEWGRVRALVNDRGENMKEAGPATPVEVLGLQGPPQAGDR